MDKVPNPPLLLQKVPTVVTFYKKVKDRNKNTKAEAILEFIKQHEYICNESLHDFLQNFTLNMYYMTAPLYLKGYEDEEVKKIIRGMEDVVFSIHGTSSLEAADRKELTETLFNLIYKVDSP